MRKILGMFGDKYAFGDGQFYLIVFYFDFFLTFMLWELTSTQFVTLVVGKLII
jgi:hypothetical protein